MSMVVEMTIREHLEELRFRLLRVAVVIIVITIFTMSFDLRPIEVNGIPLVYPAFDPLHNISIHLTFYMQDTLLPQEVSLIQTAPGQAFFSHISVRILLALVLSTPAMMREMSASTPHAIRSKRKIGLV